MTTLFLFVSALALAKPQLPDIPPDASGFEYRELLRSQQRTQGNDGLDTVLRMGERNLDWLNFINAKRPEGKKISFTSKGTQTGIPIDSPNTYNPTLILNTYQKLKADYPKELADVIFAGASFPENPPVDEKVYIEWSRKLDRSYQSAARWRTMQPWLSSLAARRRNDIRGYYFLSRLTDRTQRFANFASLPETEKQTLGEWLVGMCFNLGQSTLPECRQKWNQVVGAKKNPEEFYQNYLSASAGIYNSFFRIPSYAARSDFSWSAKGLRVPFLNPETNEVRRFLVDNVEDEWKWNTWSLNIDLVSSGPHAQIVFEPGVTPHVNGLGGDTITMNASQPLTEYDAQWTIRHEFGHVLGLPDCYVEYYDSDRQWIVNYQIDIENIMCSRRGHVKSENVAELKRVYGNQ